MHKKSIEFSQVVQLGVAQKFVYAMPTNFSLAHLFMICIRNNLNYWRNSTILILRWKIRCLIGILAGKKHTHIYFLCWYEFLIFQYFKHLQVHIENKHDEKKGGTCPQCGEVSLTIVCRNDELSWLLTKRFKAFYLICRKVFSEKLLIFVKSNLSTAVNGS